MIFIYVCIPGSWKRKAQDLEHSYEISLASPSTSSSLPKPVRATPAQDKLKDQITLLQMELDVAVRRRDSLGASEDDTRERNVKKLRQEIDKCKKELRKKEQHMRHSHSHRLSMQSKINMACSKSPDIVSILKSRSVPGRPRLDEQQPLLLKTIVDFFFFSFNKHFLRK